MRRSSVQEWWRPAGGRALPVPLSSLGRAGTPAPRHRLSGVFSPESIFRLFLAFLLATALWLYVNSRNAADVSFVYPQPIPITPENVPPGLVLANILPPIRVDVRPVVAGLAVPATSFVASIDLRGYTSGTFTKVLVHLASAPGVPVVGHSPETVTVVLEHVVSRPVPVGIHVLSPPPYGYAVKPGSLFTNPSVVSVVGPRTYVDQVGRAVVYISLSGARSGVNVSYAPTLENAQGNPLPNRVTISPGRVRVHAAIQQLASYKTLPILASLTGEPAAGFGVTSIQVTPPGLTAYGSPRALSRLTALRTFPIHIRGLRGGKRQFFVRLRAVPGVFALTRRVSVLVGVGPVLGAASIRAALTTQGLLPNETAALVPQSVLVTITGPSPRLQSAGAGLHATVDVAGLGPGTYTLAPVVTGPKGIGIASVQPRGVTVTISPTG